MKIKTCYEWQNLSETIKNNGFLVKKNHGEGSGKSYKVYCRNSISLVLTYYILYQIYVKTIVINYNIKKVKLQ